jgi:hypothetical protein
MMTKKIIWTILFAIAMGLLESAVVVYLRLLYYPAGFNFPITLLPVFTSTVELAREVATILMLIGVGVLAGNTSLQRFAYFVLAFAVWDLFYYVFLYVFLSWPSSLCDWDILFLIPLPWIGPVWAPCLLALFMMMGSLIVIRRIDQTGSYKASKWQWVILIVGTVLCIVSFMWDFIVVLGSSDTALSLIDPQALSNSLSTYVPINFNWPLFFLGFVLQIFAFIKSLLKNTNNL